MATPRGSTSALSLTAFLRATHAAVFLAIAACLFYVLFSAATGLRTGLTWCATAAVGAEGLVLIANRGRCPLSALAERLGDDSGPVTRLFFPAWFVPWVTPVFAALATLGVGIVVLQRG